MRMYVYVHICIYVYIYIYIYIYIRVFNTSNTINSCLIRLMPLMYCVLRYHCFV